MYNSVRFILRIAFSILFRMEYVGLENIPKNEPFILCSNHYGELDMFLAACRVKNHVHYMAKEELFASKFGSFFFNGIKAYPINRGTGDIKAFKTTISLLRNGEVVGILAEGTRTKGVERGTVKAKPGLALFAQKANVPVLPVAVKSNQKLFSKVKVIYCKTFDMNFEKGKKYSMEELSEKSQSVIDLIYKTIDEN